MMGVSDVLKIGLIQFSTPKVIESLNIKGGHNLMEILSNVRTLEESKGKSCKRKSKRE